MNKDKYLNELKEVLAQKNNKNKDIKQNVEEGVLENKRGGNIYRMCKNKTGVDLKKCIKQLQIKIWKDEKKAVSKAKCKSNLSSDKLKRCKEKIAKLIAYYDNKIKEMENELKSI